MKFLIAHCIAQSTKFLVSSRSVPESYASSNPTHFCELAAGNPRNGLVKLLSSGHSISPY